MIDNVLNTITFGDLFAGGGGVTTGALSIPGIKVLWALNHDEISIKTHALNHPGTKHYQADIREQDEKVLSCVDILWASLECTNYSNAKGGLPRDADSRTLAWELPRYALHCKPKYIIVENVREFLAWGPLNEAGKPVNREKGDDFYKWVEHMQSIGYINVEWRILNAANYGCHTRRERLFIIFSQKGYPIRWESITHNPDSNNILGLPKWKPARECINIDDHGKSIFGRKKPLSENTLKRIAGGIKKFSPEMIFIMKYYGNGINCHSVNEPLHTIRTHDSHTLISIEKVQFITDHCWKSQQHTIDEPLRSQLTRQTKQLITTEKKFISDGSYGTEDKNYSIDEPANTLTAQQRHQFITAYFSGSGDLEAQNQSIGKPLNAIMTQNKHALVTAFKEGLIDFDIKMRFLSPEELGKVTGFPDGYFTGGELKISKRNQVKMIGNAVPVGLAAAVIKPVVEHLTIYRKAV